MARALAALVLLVLPQAAQAHAFGQQFTLPLPVGFYIWGGMAAFIASCAVLLFFFSKPKAKGEFNGEVSIGIPSRLQKVLSVLFATLGLLFFAASLILAVFGSPDYLENPLPNFFWIIFFLLFTYITVIVGGLWEYISPFKTIASWVAKGISERQPPAWLPLLGVKRVLGCTQGAAWGGTYIKK